MLEPKGRDLNMEINKSTVMSSMIWKLLEYGGAQLIQAIVQIILARLLMPEEYGLVILVVAFILVANVFIESGLTIALIQKKDVDEIDFSSVFYLNICIAAVLYVVIFLSAPYIADFYREPKIVQIIRVLSVTIFIGAVNSCQGAFLSRNMMFKKLFLSSIIGTLVAGVIGVGMAYSGFGVWALVANNVFRQLMVTSIIWMTLKWRPKLVFSIDRVKLLFSYGSKMTISALIYTLYENLVSILIVRAYSSSALGFYNRGSQFPKLIMMNVNGTIQAVMLPTLARYQSDRVKVKNMVKRSVKTSAFLVFPMMAGLAAIAEPLVKVLLTEKWLPSVFFLQIFCACYAFWPIGTANAQSISALGRSDIFLKLETVNTSINLGILFISIPRGVHAIAIGMLVSSVLTTLTAMYPASKLLGYKYSEQLKDVFPMVLVSAFMGAAVYSVHFLKLSSVKALAIQMVLGVVLYVSIAKLFKLDTFDYLIATLRQLKEGGNSDEKV